MSEPTDYLRHELLQDLGEPFVESYDALSAEARSSFARTLRLLRSDPLANEFTAMKLAETEARLSKMGVDNTALLAVVRAVQKRDRIRRLHAASNMPPYSEVLDALAALPEHLRNG